MSDTLLFTALALIGAVVLYFTSKLAPPWTRRGEGNLPPGPGRRLPMIGHLHQMPAGTPWITFADWAKRYGNIIYLDLMGQPVVVLNSREVASDLLDKRSLIYSHRPGQEMVKLSGYNRTVALENYGPTWRRQRQMITPNFSLNNVHKYYSPQERSIRALVRKIVQDPDCLHDELKQALGKMMLEVTYGYIPRSEDDPFLTGGFVAIETFKKANTPGAWLVDTIPLLKYVPLWMPGAEFARKAKGWKEELGWVCREPFLWCKQNVAAGKDLPPNLCAEFLQKGLGEEDEEALSWVALSVLGASLDSSISTVLNFFKFMLMNPSVVAKAQAEIDSVVGTERLPQFEDRDDMPYMRSIMAEVWRSTPPHPLSIPHALSQDDVYEGYFIPKGSWIMPNVWHMLHDPEVYPNPNEFNPGRYNGDDEEMDKIKDLMFGFGRRACPGRHFAEATIFTLFATALATCDLLPGLDDEGKEITPKLEFLPESIMMPTPYKMRVKPRSAQAESLLSEISSAVE